jgi:hypothetical protein
MKSNAPQQHTLYLAALLNACGSPGDGSASWLRAVNPEPTRASEAGSLKPRRARLRGGGRGR